MFCLKDLFTLRSALLACFAIVVMQLIVASSNIWLKELSEALSAGGSVVWWLTAYAASLVLPYIPGTAYLVLKTQWVEDALARYYSAFVASHRGRADLWPEPGLRQNKESFLTTEGPQTLRDFVEYVCDVATVSLNVAFNVFALVVLVEPLYSLTLLGSLGLVFLVIRLWAPHLERLHVMAQEKRNVSTGTLFSVWDNVTLGAGKWFLSWQNMFVRALEDRRGTNLKAEVSRQFQSLVLSLFTFLPTLALAIWQVLHHQGNAAYALAILLTLPRLFMIMANFHTLVAQWGAWPAERARLNGVFKALSSEPKKDLESRIQFQNITCTQPNGELSRVSDMDSLLKLLVGRTGRFTIRGSNGAGKSTTLLAIKQRYSDSSVYIPAQHRLYSPGQTQDGMSTGEKNLELTRACLEWLKQEPQLLLLDEWDANLDGKNVSLLDAAIDELSKKMLVLEVRHRGA